MKSHDKDGDWNCGDHECSFQTISEDLLKEHKKNAHQLNHSKSSSPHDDPKNWGKVTQKETENKESFLNDKDKNYCNLCQKDFIYRIDLKKHINTEHKTYKPCRNLGTCTYSPCRYNHKVYPKGHHLCFECGKDFKTIHDMMTHRKNTHSTVLCKMFLKRKCNYSSEDCYFTHTINALDAHVNIVENNSAQPHVQRQGFWETHSNLAPPSHASSVQQGPSQSEWIQMKNTLHHLNQLMSKYQ